MNKKSIIIAVSIVVLLVVVIVLATTKQNNNIVNNVSNVDSTNNASNSNNINNLNNVDFKSISYYIDDQEVKIDGSKIQYFGNDLRQDLNNDGLEDVAFLITDNSEGSGVFYYLVAAINTGNGYTGTNAIFIGDRIAPQTINYANNEIVVNYADRKPDEPFTTAPSVGVSKYVMLENSKLVEDKK